MALKLPAQDCPNFTYRNEVTVISRADTSIIFLGKILSVMRIPHKAIGDVLMKMLKNPPKMMMMIYFINFYAETLTFCLPFKFSSSTYNPMESFFVPHCKFQN